MTRDIKDWLSNALLRPPEAPPEAVELDPVLTNALAPEVAAQGPQILYRSLTHKPCGYVRAISSEWAKIWLDAKARKIPVTGSLGCPVCGVPGLFGPGRSDWVWTGTEETL